ncbi:glycosyltransferase family 39 protein [Solirubrobacter soli]|uniref:glycosyltransferase family 39 protein n=1 Tax=Solirubrobacter soli TaxID=363832 RepID=UPI0003F5E68B|nr:glycosyltransferase family 39 protein [Solirubrobacter soli]
MNGRRVAAAVPLATGRAAATSAAVLVCTAALALRLSGLGGVAPDPFYDAAVRSMGTSWHDFLFGALEPGGSVAIDKPAVALWPQVIATKLLGFSTVSLLLPAALAGLAGVALVQRLGSALWGRYAGWAAAAAVAVAPLAVLTDRSDTMDALAVAFALLAAVALVAATRAEERDAATGRWLLAGAGAAVGAAFAVKLFQALIPVPALVVLYFAASPLAVGERLSRLVLWAAVALAVGLSWFVVVSTAPGREQPWAYGSHDGTAISAAFAYDGLARLAGPVKGGTARSGAGGTARSGAGGTAWSGAGGAARSGTARSGAAGAARSGAGGATRRGAARSGAGRATRRGTARSGAAGAARSGAGGTARSGAARTGAARSGAARSGAGRARAVAGSDLGAVAPAEAGPGRLLSTKADLRGLLGVELLPAVVIGAFAVALGWRADRRARAGALFVAAWLATGVAVLSFMPDLKVRYVDVLAPPVALALGAGIVSLTQRKAVGALLLAALLAPPAVQAVRVVRLDASDSGHLGSLTPTEATHLSAFLKRHQRTRYELASATAAKAAPLIERDDRPILMLGTQLGKPLTPLRTLRKDVRNDEVGYVLVAGPCGPHTWRSGCGQAARWAVKHGKDVSRQAQQKPGTLFALIPASARAGTHKTNARRLALDPHRRRRVDAARNAHPLVSAGRTRHVRGR